MAGVLAASSEQAQGLPRFQPRPPSPMFASRHTSRHRVLQFDEAARQVVHRGFDRGSG